MNIARRYARSLFSLGENDQGLVESLYTMGEVFTSARVLAFWRDPLVKKKDKLKLAADIVEHVAKKDRNLRNLAFVLVEARRAHLLAEIARLYEEMVKAESRIVDVVVTTSHELDEGKRDEIERAIAQKLARQINMRFVADAGILGGMLIAWEHKVWDFSLRTKLQSIVRHVVG